MGQPRYLLILQLLLGALLLCSCAGSAPDNKSALPPPRPVRGKWHEVQQGESLAALARRYHVALVDIEEINGLDREEPLPIGQAIFIPGAAKSQRRKESAERRQSPEPKAATKGQGKGLLWPVQGGTLSSTFRPRGGRPHEGIDIAAKAGTPVLAAADGLVIYSGSGLRGYGNLILVQHQDSLITVYAHNRKNLVAEGARVKRGQVIAEVGRTGRATGNHLHFEVRRGEVPQDPLPLLKRGSKATGR